MDSRSEIISRGMKCLIENLGMVDAEHFISAIGRERSGVNYTKWRQQYFDDITSEELNNAAIAYANENPL